MKNSCRIALAIASFAFTQLCSAASARVEVDLYAYSDSAGDAAGSRGIEGMFYLLASSDGSYQAFGPPYGDYAYGYYPPGWGGSYQGLQVGTTSGKGLYAAGSSGGSATISAALTSFAAVYVPPGAAAMVSITVNFSLDTTGAQDQYAAYSGVAGGINFGQSIGAGTSLSGQERFEYILNNNADEWRWLEVDLNRLSVNIAQDQAPLAAVPEPDQLSYLAAGLALLGFAARRRQGAKTGRFAA